MIPNYSAQDWAKMTFKEKWDIAVELDKQGVTMEDFEAHLRTLWPPEKKLPKAHWRVKR